jgi:16S rRNA G966 N2-methylase RsmD
MTRTADFNLAVELARPGFTPARTDAPALADIVADGAEAISARAMPALAGLGAAGTAAILARLESAIPDDAAIARLVQALGLCARAGDAGARATLLTLTGDPRVRVRRAAIVALGKLASATIVELRSGEDRRVGARRGEDGAPIVELREGETRRTRAQRRADAAASVGLAAVPGVAVPGQEQVDDKGGDQVQVAVKDQDQDEDQDDDLDDVRAVLLARWDAGEHPPDERRVLAEALGKVGGDEARARLAAIDPGGDKELARLRDRALLMVDRTAKRAEDSAIATDVAPPKSLRVRLGCRPELGKLLKAELQSLNVGPSFVREKYAAEWVEVFLTTPWSTLHRSRLWDKAAIMYPLDGVVAVEDAIVRALTSPDVLALLRAWTKGPIRWRLGMVEGHQRALVWKVAQQVTEKAPDLVNDPSATTWDVVVDPDERMLSLIPRRAEDPRFSYRVAEVPAASTGAVAAALVWAAEPRDGDRVWDPFVGSGVELVERARRGGCTLIGTDIDAEALAAAKANLAAADVTATLAIGDARTHAPGPVDFIITNPPLGSRVHVDAGALLVEALPNLVRALAPGGRIVWITPASRKTTPAATELGLTCALSTMVDLGGVRGRLERWNKR